MNGRPDLLPLVRLTFALGRVNRATRYEDGVTPESDTDHTVMLALVAAATAPQTMDPQRLVAMALVHDLVEALVGDTNTFNPTPELLAAKQTVEAEGMVALFEVLREFPVLLDWLRQYEAQEVPEARWVRILDKAMPKLTHALNGCAAVTDAAVSLDELIRRHTTEELKLLDEYPERAMVPVHQLLTEACRRAEEAHPAYFLER